MSKHCQHLDAKLGDFWLLVLTASQSEPGSTRLCQVDTCRKKKEESLLMLLTSQVVLQGERGGKKHNNFLSLSVIHPRQKQVWRATDYRATEECLHYRLPLFSHTSVSKNHSATLNYLLVPISKVGKPGTWRKILPAFESTVSTAHRNAVWYPV